MTRKLGKSGIEVSALGLGCWPIGGAWTAEDGVTPLGYGEMDDNESIRALLAAVDNGINFFDTSNVYGCGHSEKVMGEAFKGIRDKVVIASKFSTVIDEEKRIPIGVDNSPEGIIKQCEGSLRRLGTDYLDLYLFHDWGYPAEDAEPVRETLEKLVKEGKIKSYGWSTDLLPSLQAFNKNDLNSAAEIAFNVFEGNKDILKYCEDNNIAAMARSPLAMGILSDKYDVNSVITGKDIRTTDTEWMAFFQNGKPTAEFIKKRDAVKEILTSSGRSVVQGSLAYLWGKSDNLIPIPGFKNSKQAIENAKAMEFGPLSSEQVDEIDKLVK